MTRKDITTLIPDYPEGCSLIYLSYKLGLINSESTSLGIEEGKRRLLKKVNWLTVRNKYLVQREAPLQDSTKILLRKAGFNVKQLEKTEIYLSFLKKNIKEENEDENEEA